MSETKNTYSIREHADSLRIIIHNRQHWPTILWAIGCIAVMILLTLVILIALSGDAGVAAIALVAILLLVGGVMAFICVPVLNWQFGGVETITVGSDHLRITRSLSSASREKVLEASAITELGVMPTEHNIGWRWRYLRPTTISTFHIGRIAVECGGVVYRFGSGLDSTEAGDVVNAIKAFQQRNAAQPSLEATAPIGAL